MMRVKPLTLLSWPGTRRTMLPCLAALAMLLPSAGSMADSYGISNSNPLSLSVTARVGEEPILLTFSSVVSPVDPDTLDSSDHALASFLAEVRRDAQHGAPQTIWRYTYTIEVIGTPVKLNISDWRVANSPLIGIVQDFSLQASPSQTGIVQFLTNWQPIIVRSPLNLAYWDPEKRAWSLAGDRALQADLHVPHWPRGPLYVESSLG